MEWYSKAAEQGDSWAKTALERLQSSPKKSVEEPAKPTITLKSKHMSGAAFLSHEKMSAEVQEFLRKAQGGDPEAQCNLGLAYMSGRGVKTDAKRAMEWWRKSAEQGFASSCYFLGRVLTEGSDGVEKDEGEAVGWFLEAAEQGDVNSQVQLGVMYENGQGCYKNMDQAIKWYRKAAEQGDVDSQYKLGLIYLKNGKPIEKDISKGLQTLRYSENGFRDDSLPLLTKDEKQAMAWFHQAAKQGNSDAKKVLTNLTSLEGERRLMLTQYEALQQQMKEKDRELQKAKAHLKEKEEELEEIELDRELTYYINNHI